MKVLVFGGAGYIGAHTVIKLLDSNHSVVVFDNFSTGELLNVDQRATIQKGDILSKDDLKRVFKSHNFDAVMHLSALKAPGESMINPTVYSRVNIIGTLNILELMIESRIKNFIFSSSSAVYGEPKNSFIDEDHTLDPISFYGFTKLEIERILTWYSKTTCLNFIALRYFNAAGYDLKNRIRVPEKSSHNLIPKIFDVLIGNEQVLEIFGSDYDTKDGTCIRDYIHVNDLANAHVQALNYLEKNNSPIFLNLATGIGHTVLEVVEKVEEITSTKINYKFVDRRIGDPSVVISKTKYKDFPLNWKPIHSSLETIINSVLKLYMHHL